MCVPDESEKKKKKKINITNPFKDDYFDSLDPIRKQDGFFCLIK